MSNTSSMVHSAQIARHIVAIQAALQARGIMYPTFCAQALYMYHFGDMESVLNDCDHLPPAALTGISIAYAETYGKTVEARTMMRRADEAFVAHAERVTGAA